MAQERQRDANEKALAAYFLRGMRRFAKHVRAQDRFDTTADTLQARIEAAYQLAREQFTQNR